MLVLAYNASMSLEKSTNALSQDIRHDLVLLIPSFLLLPFSQLFTPSKPLLLSEHAGLFLAPSPIFLSMIFAYIRTSCSLFPLPSPRLFRLALPAAHQDSFRKISPPNSSTLSHGPVHAFLLQSVHPLVKLWEAQSQGQ